MKPASIDHYTQPLGTMSASSVDPASGAARDGRFPGSGACAQPGDRLSTLAAVSEAVLGKAAGDAADRIRDGLALVGFAAGAAARARGPRGLDFLGGIDAVDTPPSASSPSLRCDRWDIGGLRTRATRTPTRHNLHLRRLSPRRWHRREGLRAAAGALVGHAGCDSRLSVRGRLSELRPKPEVRQFQSAAG